MLDACKIVREVEAGICTAIGITVHGVIGVNQAGALLEDAVCQLTILVYCSPGGRHQATFDIVSTQARIVLQHQGHYATSHGGCLGGTGHQEVHVAIVKFRMFHW